MTYSLLLAHRASGTIAVATASYSLAAGNAVPALLPGIGGVVSQAYTNTRLRGPMLRALAEGRSPADALGELGSLDDDLSKRQLGLMAADGTSAVHTGADCSEWAGHASAPGVLAIGNLLAGPDVVDAMVASITATTLDGPQDIALRVVAALRAGLHAGGDIRGQQSAAILLATGAPDASWPPALSLDLRVDDHEHPLDELDRMLDLVGGS